MKLLLKLLGFGKKDEKKTLAEYQQEMYVRWSKKQFEKLNDLGLTIPVRVA